MLVRCVRNLGHELGPPLPEALYTNETQFGLEIGRRYPVFGLALFKATLSALIFDDGRPDFHPVGLFDFDGQRLPADWEFAVYDGAAASGAEGPRTWVALWGYPELARDPTHAERLADRDKRALEIFYLQLARDSKDLLSTVIERRLPQLLDLPPQLGVRRLKDEEREELHRAIVAEMDAGGSFRGGESTVLARELDELLDRLPYL